MAQIIPRWLLAVGLVVSGCSPAILPQPIHVKRVATLSQSTVSTKPAPLQKQTPPAPGLVITKPFPQIASNTLRNGMSLDVIERHGLPIITLSLVVYAGQSRDGSHAAVARTTAQLLEAGGAGKFTSETLRQAVDGLGASLETVTTKDQSRWSLSVTSDRIADALDILASLAYKPRFDRAEFSKLRKRELERVRSLAKTSGSWLAQYVLHRELYGQPLGIHPYASVDVLPSELERLTLEECRKFHKEQYVPANARLVAVGDVDLAKLTELAERAFGPWSGKAPEEPAIGIATPPEQLTIRVIDRPGSAQSDIFVGFFGSGRKETDFPKLVTLQQILGGGVASRLFLDVREKRSLAYSTYATTQETAQGPSVLTLYAGTQTSKTADAVGALLENLDRMNQSPGSNDELDCAKNYVIRGMPARWETVESLAQQLIILRTFELSDRYFDDLRESVERLSLESLRETAAMYYRKNRAVVVVAGDANNVAESLRQFGPIQVLDPEREFSIKRKLDAQ
jgi:predicted Zn-dependent peptidase